jgi:hypothetical protein
MTEPLPEDVERERHVWSRDGETCLKCGDKDWMGGACIPIPARTEDDPGLIIANALKKIANAFRKAADHIRAMQRGDNHE